MVVTKTRDINIAPASGGPQTPTQSMEAVWSMDINRASGGSSGLRDKQGLQQLLSTWISGFNWAWGSSMDHGYQHGLRGSFKGIQSKKWMFFILDILSLLTSRAIMWLGSMFGGWVFTSSRRLHTTLLVLLVVVYCSLPSLTLVSPVASLDPCLSTVKVPIYSLSFLPLHCIFVHCNGIGNCYNESLNWFKVSGGRSTMNSRPLPILILNILSLTSAVGAP